jgi:hypothetical protein
MTAEMRKFALNFLHEELDKDGPEVMLKIEGELASRFSFQHAGLGRMLRVSFYEGFRKVLGIKDDMALSIEEPNKGGDDKSVSIDADFTYEERVVIIIYIQYHFKFITQEQYMSEITRLGWTMDRMNDLFRSKGETLHKYDRMFKESMWGIFKGFFSKMEGFTTDMETWLYE